jgi:hypothetical protein
MSMINFGTVDCLASRLLARSFQHDRKAKLACPGSMSYYLGRWQTSKVWCQLIYQHDNKC